MTRVATTYYGADADTQFQWATDDGDPFDRELDMSFVARALERHDHSNGRGLPVARVAAGSIVTASYAAQSVDTAALKDGAVTAAKIALSVIGWTHFNFPLVQTVVGITTGFRITNPSLANTSSWYIDNLGNTGLAPGTTVFGLQMTPTGKVFVSPYVSTGYTLGKFSVVQSGNTITDGVRVIYPGNDAVYVAEYLSGDGWYRIATPTMQLLIGVNNGYFAPDVDNVRVCGHPSLRWSQVYTVGLSVGGAASIASNLTVSGVINTNGITCTTINTQSNQITSGPIVCTTINTQGNTVTSGAINTNGITCTTINTQNNQITCGPISMAAYNITCNAVIANGNAANSLFWGIVTNAITCTTINTQNNTITCGPINMGAYNITCAAVVANGAGGTSLFSAISTGAISCTTISAAGNNTPTADNAYALGDPSHRWIVYASTAFNISGAWTTYSDERLKIKSSFRPYDRGLDALRGLRPITFKYVKELQVRDEPQVGFSAQELQAAFPEFVHEAPHPLDPDGESVLAAQPGLLVYPLLNAVLELAERVKALEDRRN